MYLNASNKLMYRIIDSSKRIDESALMTNIFFSYKTDYTGFVFVLNALCFKFCVLRSLLGIKFKYIISFWVRHGRH